VADSQTVRDEIKFQKDTCTISSEYVDDVDIEKQFGAAIRKW
jgi:hypothetical protein